MRVTTQLINDNAVSAMLDQQSKLANTQQQLATGQRMLSPADDPPAAAQVVGLKDAVSTINQYQSNANAATTQLTLENNTLTSVVNSLQQANDLAVQGLNGTQSASARQGIATQLQQILDQVVSLSNTQDSEGQYVFGGYQTGAPPVNQTGGNYTYGGDAGQRYVTIGPNQQVAVNDPGSAVFMNVPAAGGGTQSVFKTLADLVAGLQSNAPSQSSLNNIRAALSQVLTVQTQVGARLNIVSSQQTNNSNNLLQTQQALSQVSDVDFVSAVSQYNQQLMSLQAAEQSFAKLQQLSLFNYL